MTINMSKYIKGFSMKKLTIILLIAAFGVIFNSCKPLTGPDEITFRNIFPAKVNNYWVYKTTWQDKFFNGVYTDSLVITSVLTTGTIPVVALSYYRDGKLYDTLEAKISLNAVDFYTQLLTPFLGASYNQCICLSKSRWVSLAIDSVGGVEVRDSLEGDSYPSLSEDPPGSGNYVTVISRTAWIIDLFTIKLANKSFALDNRNHVTHEFNLNGYIDYLITEPKNITFKKTGGCQFFDNDRRLRFNQLNMNMSFVTGIGIVRTEGVVYECDSSIVHKHTRELLKYKIN